ncbi:MAG: hypothetical protein WC356_05405 [Candidatus Micrarchaeia archaeon]|jgi:hypothetical protein
MEIQIGTKIMRVPKKDADNRLIFEKGIHPLSFVGLSKYPKKPIFQLPLEELLKGTNGEGLFLDLIFSLNALEGVQTEYFNAPNIEKINLCSDGNKIAKITDGIINLRIQPEYLQAVQLVSTLINAFKIDNYPFLERDDIFETSFFENKLENDFEFITIKFSFEQVADYQNLSAIEHPHARFSPLLLQLFMETTYTNTLCKLIKSIEQIFWGNKDTILIKIVPKEQLHNSQKEQ